MSSLINLLSVSAINVTSGEISGKVSSDLYRVISQGQEKILKTAIDSVFPDGTKVLIAKTEDGEYIIGKSNLTARYFTEVLITG